MATITYGAPVGVPETKQAAAPARKHWFSRFLDAVAEAQMRRAQREIAYHRHLLPDELERAGLKLDRKNEDSLPFVR